MYIQEILLFALVFLSPFFPSLVTPFSYPFIGVMLLEKANPRMLLLIAIGANTLGSIIIRIGRAYLVKEVKKYQEKKQHTDLFSYVVRWRHDYLAHHRKLSHHEERLEHYLEKKGWGIGLFVVSAFVFGSAIPDFVIIPILRKKVNFTYFFIASVIGKAAVYIPLIFIGKSLLDIVKVQLGW